MNQPSSTFAPIGKEWIAGSWQLELRDDEFADIHFDGRLVLRSVRAVIRDKDWNTSELVIEKVEAGNEQLKIHVISKGHGAEFAGWITFSASGQEAKVMVHLTALDDFQTNRTGLIVLHSPNCAGQNLDVTHSNGDLSRLKFPISISPHQPAAAIAALGWQDNGLQIELAFSGDVFEMEDQRNWTDASYKTYSRPLAMPFPYHIPKGQLVEQSITISVVVLDKEHKKSSLKELKLEPAGRFPAIQVGASTTKSSGTPSGIPKDFKPGNNTVLVELDLTSANWKLALRRAATSVRKLDIRIILSHYADLHSAIVELERLEFIQILRIGAFDSKTHVSPHKLTNLLSLAISTSNSVAVKNAKVVSGSRSHFTELNREQDSIIPKFSQFPIEEITFASTPLFHAHGTEQLLEAVAMQRLTAIQAVEIAKGRPVNVGPVSLRPRFNNVATSEAKSPNFTDLSAGYGAEIHGAVDYRQASPELGAWLIASAAAFAISGVSSITWFEQWGPRGLADNLGREYAAGIAFRTLSELQGGDLYSSDSIDGKIWGLASVKNGVTKILASNLHHQPVSFSISVQGVRRSIELGALSWAQVNLD